MTAFERETLRYLGNAKADERLMALIASVEAELRQEVRPRGLHRRLPIAVSEGRVEVGGHVFESSALAKNLCGCEEAFFLAATLGAEAARPAASALCHTARRDSNGNLRICHL